MTSCNHQEYFKNALTFLRDHQWLYNYKNTDILSKKHFHLIPEEWVYYFKKLNLNTMKELPVDVHEEYLKTFQEFISTILSLQIIPNTYDFGSSIANVKLPDKVKSKKKWHEIESLAKVVHDICQKNNINIIVDVGAGLGYLSFLLHGNFNYKILAVEGDSNIFMMAQKYQKEEFFSSLNCVKYINCFITKDSVDELERHLREQFQEEIKNNPRICIVGLHACADLSSVMLDIFCKMHYAKALAVMPCCYHRLSQKEDGKFDNFPISECLKTLSEKYNGGEYLSIPFLRLACQQTLKSCTESDRSYQDKHSKSWMLRAILQEIAEEENCTIRRLKRKSGKIGNSSTVVEDYVSNLRNTHELTYEGDNGRVTLIDEKLLRDRFIEKWSRYENKCDTLEFLRTFQTYIQAMCENVVLLDRVEFLRERGIDCCSYKVTDDRISPRCHALVATKS